MSSGSQTWTLKTEAEDESGLTLRSSESSWLPAQPMCPPHPDTTLQHVMNHRQSQYRRHCLSASLRSFPEEWDFLIALHQTENKVHQTSLGPRNSVRVVDCASRHETAPSSVLSSSLPGCELSAGSSPAGPGCRGLGCPKASVYLPHGVASAMIFLVKLHWGPARSQILC